jgi:hypothetical protein
MIWGNAMPLSSNKSSNINLKQITMRKQLFILGIAAISLASLNSCKKEGCIDAIADNYNADADKDDGSCNYSASVSFWYNGTTSANLQLDDISSLTFYVDNQVIGSYAANVFYPSAPACGQSSVVSKTFDLGKSKTKTASYLVKDDFGDEVWSGTVTFDASVECTTIELTY